VSEKAEVIRGPWPALRANGDPRTPHANGDAASPEAPDPIAAGKMMLGFVVRECTVALGHAPSPAELADWANHQEDERGEFCLFGRAITSAEARVILAHPGRPVSVRPERARPRGAG
jgi:hypothetical protein